LVIFNHLHTPSAVDMFPKNLLILSLCVHLASSALRRVNVVKSRNPVPGEYIVLLEPGVSLQRHVKAATAVGLVITYEWDFINAFGGTFTDYEVEVISWQADVCCIEQNSYTYLDSWVAQ